MSQKTEDAIKILKEKLSSEEYKALVDIAQNEPNSLIIQMTEQPTEKTNNFIDELSIVLTSVKSDSEEFGPGIRTMAYNWNHFQRLIRMLSAMKLSEVKLVMNYVSKLEDDDALFELLTSNLKDNMPGKDYVAFKNDERFRGYF